MDGVSSHHRLDVLSKTRMMCSNILFYGKNLHFPLSLNIWREDCKMLLLLAFYGSLYISVATIGIFMVYILKGDIKVWIIICTYYYVVMKLLLHV